MKVFLISLFPALSLIHRCSASLWHDTYGQLQSIIGIPQDKPSYLVFSENPLVIYIPSFVSLQEASELVGLSEDNFKISPLYSDTGEKIHDPNYRSSQTATLPISKIVKAVNLRARSLPFYHSSGAIKPLVVQKYALGNQYRDHYDWFFPHPSLTGNIESTFFVYIQANCTGGGTNFPRLRAKREGEEGYEMWCKYVDCDAPYDNGVTFRPITGNAVFWVNVDENGKGLTDTLHAGLPVTSGAKMGMNIWTWKQKSNREL